MRVTTSSPRVLLASTLLGLAATGCAPESSNPWGDFVADDGASPCVVATYPADGQRDWARDGSVVFTFSEPMDMVPGEVVAAAGPDAQPITFVAEWGDTMFTRLIARPISPLPPRVAVAVATTGFRDARGNLQGEPHIVRYETIDDIAPHLVASDPRDGAVVDLPLHTVTLTFDEPLDLSPAEATIEGLAAEITRFHWNDDVTEVILSVGSLLREETYTVRLDGIRDRFGNAGPPVVIDFEIAPDRTAPVVVEAFPGEGATVDAGAVDLVRVRFDEPMRALDNRAVVEVDGVAYPGWGTFSEGLRVFELRLPEAARTPGATVAVRLNGLADRHGNRLNPVPVVDDGRLDFTVAENADDVTPDGG